MKNFCEITGGCCAMEVSIAFLCMFLLAHVSHAQSEMTSEMAIQPIVFEGKAEGGILILAGTPWRIAAFVAIKTKKGESGESVAQRLAKATNQSPSFFERSGGGLSDGNRLNLYGGPRDGSFMLAGTEVGFAIPKPPTSLSARYDFDSDTLKLNWENPVERYDAVTVIFDGVIDRPLAGDKTSFDSKMSKLPGLVDLNDMDIGVVGYRKDVPSCAGVMHLAGDRQEELVNIPFSLGVAPNWNTWSNKVHSAKINFDQGVKQDMEDAQEFFDTPDEKPFYQLISGSGTSFTCGAWRKFLGLQPGSTYRISVRVNTLEVFPSPNWSYSVYAAHNATNGMTLTVDQLSGVSPLPDGSVGPNAGRIVEYGGTKTTSGKWRLHSTDTDGPGKIISNITLPAGVDSITVWTRLIGKDISLSGVGMDWVAVEKLPAEAE